MAFGVAAASNFGLGNAEYESSVGGEAKQIRHCTDLGSQQSEFQVESLCDCRQGNLTFRTRLEARGTRGYSHQRRLGGDLKQRRCLPVCCAGTGIGYINYKGMATIPKGRSWQTCAKGWLLRSIRRLWYMCWQSEVKEVRLRPGEGEKKRGKVTWFRSSGLCRSTNQTRSDGMEATLF